MITININEEVTTKTEMVNLLEEISAHIQQGYTSGITPSWNLEGDEDYSEMIEDLEEEIKTVQNNINAGLNDIEDVEDYLEGLKEDLESYKNN